MGGVEGALGTSYTFICPFLGWLYGLFPDHLLHVSTNVTCAVPKGFDLPPGLDAPCKTVTRGQRQRVQEPVAPGLAVERRKEILGTEDE